jgi:hypothetical protein
MGEIKSTLEIIMEKTKGLTLTEEEKEAFRRKEVEGKAKGVLQKLLDGLMDIENLKKEISSFDGKGQEIAKEVVIKECVHRVDLEADNSLLFDILEKVACVGTAPFQKILSEFHRDLDQKRGVLEKAFREQIQKKGISGSAVLPNLNADQEWTNYVLNAKERFREEVRKIRHKG